MNNDNERLVDTIKNVKTSSVKRFIRGIWKIFILGTLGVAIMFIIANMDRSSRQDESFVAVLAAIGLFLELTNGLFTGFLFSFFKDKDKKE